MKKYLITVAIILLIIFEIVLGVLFLSPTFVDRRSYAQAVVKWHDNPSVENTQALEKEKLKTRKISRNIHIKLGIVFVLNTCGIIILIKKRINLTKQSSRS